MANTPKIKYIRVNQGANNNYQAIVIVKNDQKDRVASVQLDFLEPFGSNPTPSTTRTVTTFIAKDSNNRKRYQHAVSFSANSLGSTYKMQATMRRTNGQTIGNVTTTNVTVDSNPDVYVPTNPSLVSAEIIETGTNASGDYLADLLIEVDDDAANVIVSVFATVSPDEATAPTPIESGVSCAYLNTVDGYKVYKGQIRFKSSSVGAQYTVFAEMKNSADQTVEPTNKFSAVESVEA